MKFNNVVLALLTASQVLAKEEWDYKHYGDDWPDLAIDGNLCGTSN